MSMQKLTPIAGQMMWNLVISKVFEEQNQQSPMSKQHAFAAINIVLM